MMRRFSNLVIFSFMAAFVLVNTVKAQQPTPSDDQVNTLAREMYCPVCENTPLDVCPTKACDQWRELIREKLGQGWTDQQIKDYFAAQYGDRVLAEPPAFGMNRLVYLLPVVFLLIAVFVVMRILAPGRVKQTTAAGGTAGSAVPDVYINRVEEELDLFKKS